MARNRLRGAHGVKSSHRWLCNVEVSHDFMGFFFFWLDFLSSLLLLFCFAFCTCTCFPLLCMRHCGLAVPFHIDERCQSDRFDMRGTRGMHPSRQYLRPCWVFMVVLSCMYAPRIMSKTTFFTLGAFLPRTCNYTRLSRIDLYQTMSIVRPKGDT
jgi:hypothetical protein